ncbi:MAG: TonB-dependent receptor, partial [Kiritimatiellia bacterium]
ARVTVEWRTLRDVYRLFLSPVDLYENRHRSSIWSGFADGRQPVSERWSFAWRAGVDHEVLRSNRLGNHSRSRGAVLALPEWSHGPLKVSAGSKLEVFTDGKPEHLPQAGIEYDWRKGCKLYASYSEAVRRPSYTELNYESPGSLGNAGLPRQKERSIETGVHTEFDNLSCRAAAFFASSDHTVDWAKLDASAVRWEAVDLGRVDTRGFEVECGYCGSILSGTCGYTILSKSSDFLPYASRYVLDFPEHLIRITATWRVANQCLLTASQGLRWQTENAARSGDSTGFPAHAVLHFSQRAFPFCGVSVAVENLWDDDFETYPELAAAPRRLSVAATIAW